MGRILSCGSCGGDKSPPIARDIDDLVWRKVADAMRDMFRAHAENDNGALSRLLQNETQEDSRSSLPGAVTEPGEDRVDHVGRGYREPWRTPTSAEEVYDVVTRDCDGKGRSSASTGNISAEEIEFSGAVEHVVDSMPMPEARNGCKAYGFKTKAALRKATGTKLCSSRKRRRRQ